MTRVAMTLVAVCLVASAQTPAWQQPLAQQRWTEAETLLKQALAEGESEPVLSGLALVYRATGRIQDADPILERLVALDESVSNIEDLARIKAGLGNFERSETLYRRAIELRNGSDVAGSIAAGSIQVHQRLAQVLLAEKKSMEAEQEAILAIRLRTRAGGPSSADLAGDNAVLARIYEAQKNWEAAARAWETAARIQGDALGYDNLRLAETLDSWAGSLTQLESFDQAESALRRALAIRELNIGPSSAEVAFTANQLGMLLYHVKRYADAEPLYRRALDIFLKLEPGDPVLVRSYDNLAVTEAMLEKFDQAEMLYRDALKLRDAEDFSGLHNLALVLVQREKLAEAEPLYSRSVAILDANGDGNLDLLKQVLTEYAALLRDLKRPADAVRIEARLKNGKPAQQTKQNPQAKQTSEAKQPAQANQTPVAVKQ